MTSLPLRIISKSKVILCISSLSIFSELNAQISLGSYDNFDVKFNRVGKLHNEHLANVISNYQIPQGAITFEDAVNNIRDFNKQFFTQNEENYFGQVQSSNVTDANFEESKYFVHKDNFTQDLLSSSGTSSLDELLSQINSIPEINNQNKALLQDICTNVKGNLEGQISNEELESKFVVLANQWIEINSESENAVGAKLTGCIITIGLKSAEFWRSHSAEMAISMKKSL